MLVKGLLGAFVAGIHVLAVEMVRREERFETVLQRDGTGEHVPIEVGEPGDPRLHQPASRDAVEPLK